MTDTILTGNPWCKKCMAHHPETYDCDAARANMVALPDTKKDKTMTPERFKPRVAPLITREAWDELMKSPLGIVPAGEDYTVPNFVMERLLDHVWNTLATPAQTGKVWAEGELLKIFDEEKRRLFDKTFHDYWFTPDFWKKLCLAAMSRIASVSGPSAGEVDEEKMAIALLYVWNNAPPESGVFANMKWPEGFPEGSREGWRRVMRAAIALQKQTTESK